MLCIMLRNVSIGGVIEQSPEEVRNGIHMSWENMDL